MPAVIHGERVPCHDVPGHRPVFPNGVGHVRVFGSHARGTSRESSDVDLLIEVNGPTTPWFPGGLVADLEVLLGCRVDVVEPDALHPEMRERALSEAVPL